jgi:hypothetical protein
MVYDDPRDVKQVEREAGIVFERLKLDGVDKEYDTEVMKAQLLKA